MKRICLFSCFASFLLLYACGGSTPTYAPVYREAAASSPARQDLPEVLTQYTYYSSADSLHLVLRFEDIRQMLDLHKSANRVDYVIRAGSTERDMLLHRDTLQVLPAHKVASDGSLQVPVTIPAKYVAAGNTMQVRLWFSMAGQERLGISHRFALRPEMLEKEFAFTLAGSEKPIFRNFATTNDKLMLLQGQDTAAVDSSAMVALLKADYTFQPALPPMSTRQEALPTAPQSVTDSMLLVQSGDTVQLTAEGLYLLQATNKPQGGLLVQGGAFPLVTRIQDMITPLIYLTTSAEREALYSATDQKAAIDNFWLKIAKDKSLARDLIRTYYTRVEAANRLYTSYKPGWATDKGMIYIIYGKPSNVSSSGDTETWIYRESDVAPYVKFVFTKKENIFTENHFELTRNREYEENWYSTVARWRAGITNM